MRHKLWLLPIHRLAVRSTFLFDEATHVLECERADEQLRRQRDWGLALLKRGLSANPPGTTPPWRFAHDMALVHAINALRSAWATLYLGYEIPLQPVVRLATEYLALALYVELSPEHAGEWLQTDKPPPSTGVLLKELEAHEDRLPYLAPLLGLMRPLLNRLSHQHWQAFAVSYRKELGDAGFFRSGPHTDLRGLSNFGRLLLLPLTSLTLSVLARTARSDEQWRADVAQFAEEVDAIVADEA